MEQLREIILLEYQGLFSINLFQALEIVFLTLLMLGIYRLLINRVFPWYFGMESTSNKNRERMQRVTRLLLFSFFVVVVLRVFNLDYKLIDESLYTIEELKKFEMDNPDAANDNPLRFVIRISTIIKAFLVFVVANVLDLVLGEVLTQRFQRRQSKAKKSGASIAAGAGLPDRIKWLKPVLYMLAIIVIVNDTGLAPYKWFDVPIGNNEEGMPFTIGRIANTVFLFLLISLVINFFVSFLLRGYYQRSKIDTGSQFAINRLFTYFAYLIGILLVIQAAGFNLVAIWTGAAALLVGIGIGLQQTFNDLICGIIILFERSVKVGDVVELIGHQVGTVRRIGARTSIVETRDDIIIFVPNSKLIGENVVNWSTINRTARFHVTVNVAYGSDTAVVKEILEHAAGEHPRILDTPQPFVRFLEFGDSSLNFEILFWSRDFIRVENIKSDLRFAIDSAFRARGIEIPFPQRDLWIRGGLPGMEQETPSAEE